MSNETLKIKASGFHAWKNPKELSCPCPGSKKLYGVVYEGSFKCPECEAEWATCEIDPIYVPMHERQESPSRIRLSAALSED